MPLPKPRDRRTFARRPPFLGQGACTLGLGLLLIQCYAAHSQWLISEVLLNPPGTDTPNEYLELRGPPNSLLPTNTYLLVLEGDNSANPGLIQNLFDLSDVRLGGNGFLVLLQKGNAYTLRLGTTVLVHTNSGSGFGSGSSSSIRHRGESGQTDLENGSSTFLLVQTASAPDIGDDLDSNEDGTLDPSDVAQWILLDSIGVLDNDGAGDVAYGAINFRRNSAATASGTIVSVPFTVDYVGRSANTSGSAASDWIASRNLEGTAPQWYLGDTADTLPTSFAGIPLDHIGGPNFGAPTIPGVILIHSDQSTQVSEDGAPDSYALALNTAPLGPVQITIRADSQTSVSLNPTTGFAQTISLTLSSTNPASVHLRAINDNAIETRFHRALITHQVTASGDAAQYPLATLIAPLEVFVLDNDGLLLSEVKVNPPGEDAPFEFLELRGTPQATLAHVSVVVLDGDTGDDPGEITALFPLAGLQLGPNGLLLIAAPGHPYAADPNTTVVLAASLGQTGGHIDNGSISILLVTTETVLEEGQDLDQGDNGFLEGLPEDATILDALGWTDGGNDDLVYGGVILELDNGTPDAATRFPNNPSPFAPEAWIAGDLDGDLGASLHYDPLGSTPNLPPGTMLTPGAINNTAPIFQPLPAWSGVISDPTNPDVMILFSDAESTPGSLQISATSDNPLVIPNTNLTLTLVVPGQYRLHLEPIGIGYATITLSAGDGQMTGLTSFEYAASAAGYPTSRYHTQITDASAAIPLSAEAMLVADDENQILRIYSRLLSGPPTNGFDMGPFLGLTDIENGKPREVDIEGATRVGNRIYWIGSHSHANIGELRTNRSRIFATDQSGSGFNTTLTYVGRYEHLKADLIAWDANNRHGKGANYYGLEASAAEGVLPKEPHGAGFNIEALAMAPGSTQTAWICFRAPIVPATNRAYSLIVPVTNFASLAISDAQPGAAAFGTPIELDLQGRGLRSVEGNTNGYLLVTGPPGDTPTPFPPYDFKLYTWSGNPLDRPQQRAASLADLTPEALVQLPPHPWTQSSQVQLLSDNGRTDFYNDGTQGKFLPEPNFKKFRSDLIAFGPVVRPQPFLTEIRITNSTVSLTWRSNPGDTYQVQYKDRVDVTTWSNLLGDVTATGPFAQRSTPLTSTSQMFYQVLMLP